MKKTIILIILLVIGINSIFLYSDKRKEKEKLYMSALTEKNLEIKFQKLEEYYTKYGKKKKNLTGLFFITLVETTLKLKKYKKTEEYVQKALKFKKLKDVDRIKIRLGLAYVNAYSKKDFKAAISIADEVIESAKKNKDLSEREKQRELIGPATRLKIASLDFGSKDLETTRMALKASLELYNTDKSSESATFVFHFCKRLFEEYNKTDEAFKILEILCKSNDPNSKHVEQVALWYYDLGYEDKAQEKMKKAYFNKTSKRAYYIGKIVYEKNVDEALKYLAEASVLSKNNYAEKALSFIKRIFAEEKAKDLSDEEKEERIQKLLNDARERLNK